MKKIAIFSFVVIVISSCGSKELSQADVEAWIAEHMADFTEFSTESNGRRKYRGRDNNIWNVRADQIGIIKIDDEATISVPVTLLYTGSISHSYKKSKQRENTVTFIFQKSTDDQWYLSSIKDVGCCSAFNGLLGSVVAGKQ